MASLRKTFGVSTWLSSSPSALALEGPEQLLDVRRRRLSAMAWWPVRRCRSWRWTAAASGPATTPGRRMVIAHAKGMARHALLQIGIDVFRGRARVNLSAMAQNHRWLRLARRAQKAPAARAQKSSADRKAARDARLQVPAIWPSCARSGRAPAVEYVQPRAPPWRGTGVLPLVRAREPAVASTTIRADSPVAASAGSDTSHALASAVIVGSLPIAGDHRVPPSGHRPPPVQPRALDLINPRHELPQRTRRFPCRPTIRARSTRLAGSVRDRVIDTKPRHLHRSTIQSIAPRCQTFGPVLANQKTTVTVTWYHMNPAQISFHVAGIDDLVRGSLVHVSRTVASMSSSARLRCRNQVRRISIKAFE